MFFTVCIGFWNYNDGHFRRLLLIARCVNVARNLSESRNMIFEFEKFLASDRAVYLGCWLGFFKVSITYFCSCFTYPTKGSRSQLARIGTVDFHDRETRWLYWFIHWIFAQFFSTPPPHRPILTVHLLLLTWLLLIRTIDLIIFAARNGFVLYYFESNLEKF